MFILSVADGVCQETVFMLLKSDRQLADAYFEKKNFPEALSLYLGIAGKNDPDQSIDLKIARCYYFLKQYEQAIAAYEKNSKENLPLRDLYYYAEAQSGMGNYEKAIEYYSEYLSRVPDDQLIIQKIWRLSNIQYLYEDSLHYALRPLKLNTDYGELCAVPYRDGIVFMSNRDQPQLIDHIDATINAPFYRLYYTSSLAGTTGNSDTLRYAEPAVFSPSLNSKYHVGPVAFYQQAHKMAFVTTGDMSGKNDGRTLQLYFAAEREGAWEITAAFPYNNPDYSISDVAISYDGKLLIFSSDMEGGFGGKDLYRSQYLEGRWTEPVNLGATINTIYDETFPYIHLNYILYFSSNGHAGLGGLDLFKTELGEEGFGEIQNLGYPLNTSYDDFGITMDSSGVHGYLSSNRKNGGYDDDIYEFDIDIQTYPLIVHGLVKYKEHNWDGLSAPKVLENAKLYLIDKIRDVQVSESVTDSTGNFSIVVPYFSKYLIKVSGENIDEGIVSFEIPRHKKIAAKYEIVVVRDPFNSPEKTDVK